ncbi:Hira-domain-containing protein [Viridothelium virens]|uniref:Protein HIR n=1 Tax=Viridothelium virens TaxID=1048519 RepID=A0A6A6HAS0_VIRVR|nr:Hira-domain-containing protein [Viridothelium virens]
MRFIKPQWLVHPGEKKDHEVYSCHVSPDGSRLVTVAGDGYVRIWSTEAIYNIDKPEYASQPKQLAAMTYHSGTIHSVRFSGNNKYLASGADDKLVCVYVLDTSAPPQHSTFELRLYAGSNEPPPVENWRVFRRLIGHENDVQDLGWSYDSSILVSVGLDSKLVVWSGHTFEKLKTLSQHQSHVKGITFDPANKYFATASDDRTIKIFRFTSPPPNATSHDQVHNFVLEHTVSKPFSASPLTTYFRRCSWSPDGNHIAAANATNGPVSSVAIINRGTWESEINLIGHEGPVEVTAFSPRLFSKEPPPPSGTNEQQPPSVTVIACAGQDKTLSVWNTSFPRPFFISHELAAKSISDLAWTPDGEKLFLTSLDGTVGLFIFQKGELGYPVDTAQNEKALEKFGVGRRIGVVEGTDAYLLEEHSKAGELRGVQGRMGELMGDGAAQRGPATNGISNGLHPNGVNSTSGPPEPSAPLTNGHTMAGAASQPPASQPPPPDPQQQRIDRIKQRVTITKDGKKRITPLLLSSSSGVAESALPKPHLQASAQQRTQVSSENAPETILDLSKPFDGLPKGGLGALLFGNKRKYAEMEDENEVTPEKRAQEISRQGGQAPIVLNRPEGLVAPQGPPIKDDTVPEFLRPAIPNPGLSLAQIRLAVPHIRSVILRPLDRKNPTPPAPGPSSADNAQVADGNGSNPSASASANADVNSSSSSSSSVVFECRNSTHPPRTGRAQDREPTRVSLTRAGLVQWTDFLPRAVIQATGNRHFWAACCEDGSVHVWTPAGRRYLNPLVLEAQGVILDCRGWWLMCITAAGLVHLWDLRRLRSGFGGGGPVSLAPVLDAAAMSQGPHLTGGPSLVWARLNQKGRVVLAMSNGDGFTYSPELGVWQRLSEMWWAVGSQYWNTLDESVRSVPTMNASSSSSSAPTGQLRGGAAVAEDGGDHNDEDDDADDLGVGIENLSAGIVPLVERNTTDQTLLRGRAYFLQRLVKSLLSAEGYENFESVVSIGHLENRVAAALTLGAREEFRMYLLMYAKRLGSEGLKGKVEELLRSLVGHWFVDEGRKGEEDGEGWQTSGAELVGWKRDGLVKEVVLILGKHRDLQRITLPYARLLGIIHGTGGGDNGEEMVTDI